jgi:glycosyltransferase involved in cell wall biosynthesis
VGGKMSDGIELTVLMPCLNEAETIARCIGKARSFLLRNRIVGEIVVADNGSTDGSQAIAGANGARVVDVPHKGYGNALIGGIRASKGTYIIMGDSDDSYDFAALEPFVEKLREGYQLVMGNRFEGGIRRGAMPALHRYFGNPILSAIGRVFFGSPCGDFYCGLRGFDRAAVLSLDLRAPGMEFAHEMVVKATIDKLTMTDVPTVLSPDGRSRPPHLRSWRDGWRTLRFLLLFCPRWLFLYPGLGLLFVGLIAMAWLLPQPRRLGSTTFDIHTLFYASLGVVVGYQSVLFWAFAKLYGAREGVGRPDRWFKSLAGVFTLELGLIIGAGLLLIGLTLAGYALGSWGMERFGPLSPFDTMRLVIPSGTAILLAFQTAYSAFFMSVLEIRAVSVSENELRRRSAEAA